MGNLQSMGMGNSPSTGAPGARSVFSACSASGRVISTAGVRQDSGSHSESNSILLVHMYAPHVCPSPYIHPYPHTLHSLHQKRASPLHTLTPSHSCMLYVPPPSSPPHPHAFSSYSYSGAARPPPEGARHANTPRPRVRVQETAAAAESQTQRSCCYNC